MTRAAHVRHLTPFNADNDFHLIVGQNPQGQEEVYMTMEVSGLPQASADAFAASVMRGLGRSPRPLGEFLLRLTGPQNDGPVAMLASHPLSQDRLAALKKDDSPADGPALLDESEWRALKSICVSGG